MRRIDELDGVLYDVSGSGLLLWVGIIEKKGRVCVMNKLAKVAASFVALAFVVAPAVPVSAADIDVTADNIAEKLEGATAGDVLRLADGTYPASLKIDKSVTLTSTNKGAILQSVEVAADGVVLDGLSFTAPEGGGVNGVILNNAKDVKIINNVFTGNYKTAVTGSGVDASGLEISGNNFDTTNDANRAHDVFIATNGDGITVKDNNHFSAVVQIRGIDDSHPAKNVTYEGNTWDMKAHETAISVVSVDGLKINQNSIKSTDTNDQTNGYGISLMGGVSNVVISDNTISGEVVGGIGLWQQPDYAGNANSLITISGNTVDNTRTSSIAVLGGNDGVVIENNTLSNSQYGVSVKSSMGLNGSVEIAGGNTISNMSEAAIYVGENAVAEGEKVKVATNTNTFTNNAADIVAENDADVVEKVEEEVPPTPETPDTDTDTPEVTEPVKDKESTDKADVTAPNTGTTISAKK